MRTISLYTKDEKFVANVEIAPFADDRMPEVVTWGIRCFLHDKTSIATVTDYFECFAYAAVTPSPGLDVEEDKMPGKVWPPPTQRCVRCGETDQTVARSARQDCPNDAKGVHGWMPLTTAKATMAALMASTVPPVDMTARTRTDGGDANDPAHRVIDPTTGMQQSYVVLTAEERAKGFVRPVRRSYIHEKCGTTTTMGFALSESYARAPAMYSGTFCVRCKDHFPVGEAGEFVWEDGSKVGT